MKHRLEFDFVLQHLAGLQNQLIETLRQSPGDATTLAQKRQTDRAIACLNLAAQYQLHPDSEITRLPSIQGNSFGEYRILEVDEMDAPLRVLEKDGEPLWLYEGDLLVKLNHPFQFEQNSSPNKDQTS